MRILEDAHDGDGNVKEEKVPITKRNGNGNVCVKRHVCGISDQKIAEKQTCHVSLQDGHLRT